MTNNSLTPTAALETLTASLEGLANNLHEAVAEARTGNVEIAAILGAVDVHRSRVDATLVNMQVRIARDRLVRAGMSEGMLPDYVVEAIL